MDTKTILVTDEETSYFEDNKRQPSIFSLMREEIFDRLEYERTGNELNLPPMATSPHGYSYFSLQNRATIKQALDYVEAFGKGQVSWIITLTRSILEDFSTEPYINLINRVPLIEFDNKDDLVLFKLIFGNPDAWDVENV